jgi:hypothetical protein
MFAPALGSFGADAIEKAAGIGAMRHAGFEN